MGLRKLQTRLRAVYSAFGFAKLFVRSSVGSVSAPGLLTLWRGVNARPGRSRRGGLGKYGKTPTA